MRLETFLRASWSRRWLVVAAVPVLLALTIGCANEPIVAERGRVIALGFTKADGATTPVRVSAAFKRPPADGVTRSVRPMATAAPIRPSIATIVPHRARASAISKIRSAVGAMRPVIGMGIVA